MINTVKIARILIAILFILSTVSKLISLPFFDGLVAELLLGKNYFEFPQKLWWTQLFTRALVTFELVLGIAILLEWKVKKIIVPAILFLLVVFTLHLVYESFEKGFWEGNCGCFGDVLPMTIGESVIKNITTALLGIFVLIKYEKKERNNLSTPLILLIIGAVTMYTLFLSIKSYGEDNETSITHTDSSEKFIEDTNEPMDSPVIRVDTMGKVKEVDKTAIEKDNTSEAKNPKENALSNNEKTLLLLSKYKKYSDGSTPNYSKGNHLVCLFSMTCSHCQEVIKDICEVGKSNLPSTHLINYGAKFEQAYFFSQAGGCDYAHVLLGNYTEFKKVLEGKDFPRILSIKNGQIVKEWDVDSYNTTSFKTHFGIKEKKEVIDPLNPNKKTDGTPKEDKPPWE